MGSTPSVALVAMRSEGFWLLARLSEGLEAKIFSREHRGRSVVAAAAYRNGGKIRDEKYDRVHDYSRRSKGVVESVILRPENSPEWTAKPDTLWNTVELTPILQARPLPY
jgi:hypothetical protein